MKEIKDMVVELLKAYPLKMRQLELLKYELDHPVAVGEEEMIESLSFSERSLDSEGSHGTGNISNKTMVTALQYRDNMEQANSGTLTAITREMLTLEADVGRLDHYISLLDKHQAKVIRLFYFEGMTWLDMEKELHMSKRALIHHRDEAVGVLVTMYTYMLSLQGEKGNKKA